jgi:tripartite-type tricarboxylate transporter receptor subunit TctC
MSAEIAAKATPDGYTLLMNLPSGMVTGKILMPQLNYVIPNDFDYVTLVAEGTYVLVAHPSVGVKSVSDVVALAKSKPDLLRCGSAGVGSPPHLAVELFKLRTGASIVHVPYKGAGPMVAALTGGEVQLGFASVPGVSALVKAGRLHAIAVSSSKRTKALSTLPTIAESGYPDFDVTPRYGYMVPAATPKNIVRFLNAEIGKILDSPDVQTAFMTQGLEATRSTPEGLRRIVDEELARWTRIMREARITAG